MSTPSGPEVTALRQAAGEHIGNKGSMAQGFCSLTENTKGNVDTGRQAWETSNPFYRLHK